MPVERSLASGLGTGAVAWWRKNLPWILVTFAASVLVFSPVLLGNLQNPDSRWIGDFYIADHWDYSAMWESRQGRWALTLVDSLRGGLNDSLVLTRLPALFFYAAGAQLAVDLLGLRGRTARVLAPLVLVLNPCVYEILTYRYCCFSYGLSYLLAVLAVAAVVRLPGRYGIPAGAACLAFSLGLYQASLAVAAALCLMLCVLRLLRTPGTQRAVLTRLGHMLLMGAAGLAVYCVVLFSVLAYNHESLTSYNGAGNFGAAHILLALPAGLVKTYQTTFAFFFSKGIVANHFGMRYCYAALLGLGLLAGLYLLWHNAKAGAKKNELCLAALLAVLLPPALNCMSIIIPENSATPRASLALPLVVVFALALVGAAPLQGKLYRVAPALPYLAMVALLWASTRQCMVDAQVMTLRKNLYKTVATELYADLVPTPGYGSLPLLVVGQLPNENYPDPAADLAEYADTVAEESFCWEGLRYANLPCWQNFYREELGIIYPSCSLEEAAAVQKLDAFAAMPNYPAPGSIATLTAGDSTILVAKLSEP